MSGLIFSLGLRLISHQPVIHSSLMLTHDVLLSLSTALNGDISCSSRADLIACVKLRSGTSSIRNLPVASRHQKVSTRLVCACVREREINMCFACEIGVSSDCWFQKVTEVVHARFYENINRFRETFKLSVRTVNVVLCLAVVLALSAVH